MRLTFIGQAASGVTQSDSMAHLKSRRSHLHVRPGRRWPVMAGRALMYEAFGRQEEHLYELQLGKWPHDPEGPCYSLDPRLGAGFGGGKPAGDGREITIDSLGLEGGRAFGYWFDFGDDWWHQINVEAIEAKVPGVKLPRVTKRVGKSPPQYAEEDE